MFGSILTILSPRFERRMAAIIACCFSLAWFSRERMMGVCLGFSLEYLAMVSMTSLKVMELVIVKPCFTIGSLSPFYMIR